jgi:hypothetical protein
MKAKLLLTLVILAVLSTSCTVTKYTHSQYMDTEILNQTQFGIVSKLGPPTTKKIMGPVEEWVYVYGQDGKKTRLSSASSFQTSDNTSNYSASSYSKIYDKYMMITFRKGRVIKWETQGVDYTVKGSGGSGAGSFIL